MRPLTTIATIASLLACGAAERPPRAGAASTPTAPAASVPSPPSGDAAPAPTRAPVQAEGCSDGVADYWDALSQAPPSFRSGRTWDVPGELEATFTRTVDLEVAGRSVRVVAGIPPSSGDALDSIAVWAMRCEGGHWRWLGGFVDGSGNRMRLCNSAPAGVEVLREESVPGVDARLLRVEASWDSCGVACGNLFRRFVLARIDPASGVPAPAFRCTAHEDEYIVSAEAADSYGCGDVERRRLIVYRSGAIRVRRQRPRSGPWVDFIWNGQTFAAASGQSDCDRQVTVN